MDETEARSQSVEPKCVGERKNWHRRKHERPAEILAAARELFALRGYAATRMVDIAVRAGVTKGTVYLYFYSKLYLFNCLAPSRNDRWYGLPDPMLNRRNDVPGQKTDRSSFDADSDNG